MVDLIAVGEVIGYVVSWGAASTNADDQVVKIFPEKHGAILMVFVPLVYPPLESFALRYLGEALELEFYPVHEEGVIGVETYVGELVHILEEVGYVLADAVRPNWRLLAFVERTLRVLGTGFDGLGCDGLDDGMDADVPDLEALATGVKQVCFPHVCWEDLS